MDINYYAPIKLEKQYTFVGLLSSQLNYNARLCICETEGEKVQRLAVEKFFKVFI